MTLERSFSVKLRGGETLKPDQEAGGEEAGVTICAAA
jgi:hypothetical protein